MKCYDCDNESTHFIAWDDGLFELCAVCYDEALQESVARNALPKLMGAF